MGATPGYDLPFMRSVGRRTARVGLVATLVAASLVGGWISPARAITVPRTLAEAERHTFVGADIHREVLDFPATHIAFSWVGDHGARIRFRIVEPSGSDPEWTKVTPSTPVLPPLVSCHSTTSGRSTSITPLKCVSPCSASWF